MALTDLGFTELQAHLYLALLGEPAATPARLAELVGVTEKSVRATLASLVALDVGRLDESSPAGIVLGRPAAALGPLIERVEDDLLRRYRRAGDTRAELVELTARFAQQAAPGSGTADVERLDTIDAVRDALDELAFFTRTSVYAVQPGGPMSAAAMAASRPLDLRGLRRGVDMRVIYEASVLGDEPSSDYLNELHAAGAQVRITDHALERMVIMDEQVAVIPIDPLDSRRGALVVRQPGLLAGFLRLYHRLWADARPLPMTDEAVEPELTEDDRQVLKLLASGSTDEAAARVVGISVRHLRRRVARLMERLDASSRFEAGFEAARRGWI